MKVARPTLRGVWSNLKIGFLILIQQGDVSFLRNFLSISPGVGESLNIRVSLLRGTYHNLRDFSEWMRYTGDRIARTYGSFFGIVNVSRYAAPLAVSEEVWLSIVKKIFEDTLRTRAVSCPKNFGVRHGRIVFLDYAAPEDERLLTPQSAHLWDALSRMYESMSATSATHQPAPP